MSLRWAAIAGQIATIAGVQAFLHLDLPLGALGVIIAIEAATNAFISLWLRRRKGVPQALPIGALVVDVLALTGLLYWTGGPHNPFNFLYLVYIALAAVVLRPAASWALVLLSCLAFGGLFVDSVPLGALGGHGDHGAGHEHHAHQHGAGASMEDMASTDPMALHLRGMWVAFAVGAGFIVSFVTRVKRTLAEQEEALAFARESALRSERLASLATLAAGAAHELATPLGTIAIVAKELELELEHRGGAASAVEDARLIRSQVSRCRKVLDQLAVDAGESPGETERRIRLDALVSEALDGLPSPRVLVDLGLELQERCLVGFPTALAQTLRGLIRNGLDASGPDGVVRVTGEGRPSGVVLSVVDEGEGMDPATLARATEPFFTTKEHGQGMGLGLFLARTAVERLGGTLTLRSRPGEGTTVDLFIPGC